MNANDAIRQIQSKGLGRRREVSVRGESDATTNRVEVRVTDGKTVKMTAVLVTDEIKDGYINTSEDELASASGENWDEAATKLLEALGG